MPFTISNVVSNAGNVRILLSGAAGNVNGCK